ncbi:cytochrome C biogenesis protein [Virgibacillus phasianinus]|uniref:Cytochrome C biogenesis protein n=1 Tax=Virgibacillus phasianinus TaxID=2017483 RepID=A0A220U557_9BACI|nr:TlpA disulfide reductase family protein [Virgibacillus phasianinus]ASK63434.1 cytochrome C biogenesis protein [Virgibacillus phasianinus]
MIKKVLAAAILIILVVLLIINVTNKPNNDTGSNEVDVTGNTNVDGAAIVSPSDSGLEVGKKAPDFELETLSGETIKLSDLQGKKVFINFWASWCPPCKKEMPELQEFYKQHSDEIEVLAITSENNLKDVREYIDHNSYSFPVLLDKESQVTSNYGVITIPTTYFVGTDGVIQQPKKIGPMTHDFMVEMLEKLN